MRSPAVSNGKQMILERWDIRPVAIPMGDDLAELFVSEVGYESGALWGCHLTRQ